MICNFINLGIREEDLRKGAKKKDKKLNFNPVLSRRN